MFWRRKVRSVRCLRLQSFCQLIIVPVRTVHIILEHASVFNLHAMCASNLGHRGFPPKSACADLTCQVQAAGVRSREGVQRVSLSHLRRSGGPPRNNRSGATPCSGDAGGACVDQTDLKYKVLITTTLALSIAERGSC